MGRLVNARISLRPTLRFLQAITHSKPVSEGTRHKLVATRTVLGRKVQFFNDGTRAIGGTKEVSEQEAYDSELLRFAHASILTGVPAGEKSFLWVDSSKDPVEIWLYGKQIRNAKDILAHRRAIVERGLIDRQGFLESGVIY